MSQRVTTRRRSECCVNRGLPNLFEHLGAVRRYARTLGRDPAQVDDLVQECLMRALSRPQLWREVRNVRAYLLTILHNLHVDAAARRRRDLETVPIDEARSELACAPGQLGPLLLRDLVRALQALPEHRRRVVLLTALEGLSYQEVADLLNVPIGTVMSRLSRARGARRDTMDDADPASVWT